MKIVVTGGAGFIGSNAAEHFLKKGHDVVVLDNLSRKGSRENLERLKALPNTRLEFASIDIRHADAIRTFFETHRDAEAVLHLAGQVAVTTSVTDPRSDFDINAFGTFNVLEGIRAAKSRPVILFSSTNKVYGSLPGVAVKEGKQRYQFSKLKKGVNEEMLLDFHSPYGCSKGAADQYIRDYARIYGMDTVVFRQSCIYGQNQLGIEDQGWIAWFCIATLFDRPITVYGNGKQVRDVLHIDDLVTLYEKAILKRKKVSGEIFNIGGGPQFTLSLIELIAFLEKRMGRRLMYQRSDWRPGDQPIYVSDISYAKEKLGWTPKIDPKRGIEKLFDWIESHRELIQNALFRS